MKLRSYTETTHAVEISMPQIEFETTQAVIAGFDKMYAERPWMRRSKSTLSAINLFKKINEGGRISVNPKDNTITLRLNTPELDALSKTLARVTQLATQDVQSEMGSNKPYISHLADSIIDIYNHGIIAANLRNKPAYRTVMSMKPLTHSSPCA